MWLTCDSKACVMNFLSHSMAYSLYPFSTFCDRQSLPRVEQVAAEKYKSHGWNIKHFLSIEDLIVWPSELGVKRHEVGDSLCWSFQFDTGVQGKEWRVMNIMIIYCGPSAVLRWSWGGGWWQSLDSWHCPRLCQGGQITVLVILNVIFTSLLSISNIWCHNCCTLYPSVRSSDAKLSFWMCHALEWLKVQVVNLQCIDSHALANAYNLNVSCHMSHDSSRHTGWPSASQRPGAGIAAVYRHCYSTSAIQHGIKLALTPYAVQQCINLALMIWHWTVLAQCDTASNQHWPYAGQQSCIVPVWAMACNATYLFPAMCNTKYIQFISLLYWLFCSENVWSAWRAIKFHIEALHVAYATRPGPILFLWCSSHNPLLCRKYWTVHCISYHMRITSSSQHSFCAWALSQCTRQTDNGIR